jgi:hypothetical protein
MVPIPFLTSLLFQIHSASGLAKTDTFGGNDVYCVVRINGAEAARTTVVKDTLDPEWGQGRGESFIVSLPVNLMKADLRLELWDHDNIGADDFLGEVMISTAQLITGMADEAVAEKIPKVKSAKPGKQIQATDFTFERRSSKSKISVKKQAHSLVTKFQKNKGNPGCASGAPAQKQQAGVRFVRRDLQPKHQSVEAQVTDITSVKRQADNLVGKFKKRKAKEAEAINHEPVVLGAAFGLGLAAKMTKIAKSTKEQHEQKAGDEMEQIVAAEEGAEGTVAVAEEVSKEPVATEEEVSKEPVATEEEVSKEPVATEEEVSKEPVATEEEVSKEPVATEDEVSKEPVATEEELVRDAKKKKRKAAGAKYVKGQLGFEWELLEPGDVAMADGDHANGAELVQLKVHSANGLSADLFGLDIPDAYCKIIWNEREIGRTGVVQDDRTPAWEHEVFEILVKPLELSSSYLRVEVWDKDFATKDDFLGQIILTAEQMLHLPPVGEGDHKLHKKQAKPQENTAAAAHHDGGKGRRHSVIGLTDGGYASEFRLRKKTDFHGTLGIGWQLSDQDAELTTAWRNHPRK